MDQVNEDSLRLNETVENTETGAILYDRALINQISDASFRPETWQWAVPVTGALRSAGRGNTMFVGDGKSEFVLRHYRRGGVPGRMNRDLYLWLGGERTRAFAEWRLLARLTAMGLPVPRPAAARFRRVAGFFYTADLLTVRVQGIRSLSDRLLQNATAEGFWSGVGEGIRRFHEAGVCHADLNAYNVQVDADDAAFLLDFDRGRLRPPGTWQQRNLARLYRSLVKIRQLEPRLSFSQASWQQLMQGYSSASRSL
ncbi:MAG: 3-deoxy-D-manno-octulosonic acid kinase [Woeseia sp.]